MTSNTEQISGMNSDTEKILKFRDMTDCTAKISRNRAWERQPVHPREEKIGLTTMI